MANNEKIPSRNKGYYKFSKKYPSLHGSSYAIGESRKLRKKERARKVLFAVLLCCIFIATFVTVTVFVELSNRPLPSEQKTEDKIITVDNLGTVRAIFIENEVLEDTNAFGEALKSAKDSGFNAVMLDLKTQEGILTYETSLLKNAEDNFNYIDKTIIDLIKENELMLVARIFCFEDSIAPQRIGAYVYEDVEKTKIWFDAPAIEGGKVWLDPTNATAQNYICSIIKEVVALGADCIYLDAVEFPLARENSTPVYTADDTTLDKNNVLLEFIEKATKSAGTCPLILGVDLEGTTTGNSEKWGGTLFDTPAPICSPIIFKADGGNYITYISDYYKTFNEKVKNNYSTIKIIPTVKNQENDDDFYSNLSSSDIESYIIVPWFNKKAWNTNIFIVKCLCIKMYINYNTEV